MKLISGMAAALIVLSVAHASADDMRSANYLCAIVDSTGLTSAKCQLAVWQSAIVATIDMNTAEARDLCGKIAVHMKEKGYTFARPWTLQIRSPYSGENSIAFCDMPR